MSWHGGWDYYPKPKPKKVIGGIRLRKPHGEIAGTWWGKRWIEALEKFGWHTRLERGRRYARQGQVAGIRVESGVVHAQVQGSRPQPYDVKISLHAFSRKDWARAADALARAAIHSAKLLAGEMPQEIESVFRDAQLSLFPESKRDLVTDCSCPDWENPCKHIAAAHYILGQEFDRDPFLLFKMRGIDREELLAEVRAHRRADTAPQDPDGWRNPGADDKPAAGALSTTPALPTSTEPEAFACLDDFFHLAKPLPAEWKIEPHLLDNLPKPGVRIREMGAPAFWQGENNFEIILVRCCHAARARALEQAITSTPQANTACPATQCRR